MAYATEDSEGEEFTSYDRLVEITRIDSAEDFVHAWKELREIPGDGKHLTFPIVYNSNRTRADWLTAMRNHGSEEFELSHSLLRFTRFHDKLVTIVDMMTTMHGAVAAFFQGEMALFLGAANFASLSAGGCFKNGTVASWSPSPTRTYPNPIPNGPPLATYVPSVVLLVGWSESSDSLERGAAEYLAMVPPVRAAILVKLVKGSEMDQPRARIRSNGDVAMRMRCKVVTAANRDAAWIEFGSDIVNGAPRVAASVEGADAVGGGPTLDLSAADLYDGAVVPAGLPAQIQFPLLSLQRNLHDAYLVYLRQR